MDEPIDLDDYRPHLCVDCTDFGGAVHVLPVSNVKRWIADPDQYFDLVPIDVLRIAVREWLANVPKGAD